MEIFILTSEDWISFTMNLPFSSVNVPRSVFSMTTFADCNELLDLADFTVPETVRFCACKATLIAQHAQIIFFFFDLNIWTPWMLVSPCPY